MTVAMLILLAAPPLGELAAWADGVAAGRAEPGARSFANRDYTITELPEPLHGAPRVVFAGGAGDRTGLRFRRQAVVVAAFRYNDTGQWDWPDRAPASAHGWTLWRWLGYRGASNGTVGGQPARTHLHTRTFAAGEALGEMPPWWLCAAILPVDEWALIEAAHPADPLPHRPLRGRREPWLVAHRGLMSLAPENTLPALALALELGFGIEFDVLESADGETVVMHDATVDRTTNGHGAVRELRAEAIFALDAGSWFHPSFAGERVPTLRQVLEMARDHSRLSSPLAINLKQTDREFIARVCAQVRELGMAERSYLFDVPIDGIDETAAVAGGVRLYVAGRTLEDLVAAAGEPAVSGVWSYFVPTVEQVAALHAARRAVHVTPLLPDQSRAVLGELLRAGVDGFCTDQAPHVRRVWRLMCP